MGCLMVTDRLYLNPLIHRKQGDVVDQCPQHHFLLLTLRRSRAQRGALVPLDHTVRRLALGTLAVLLLAR